MKNIITALLIAIGLIIYLNWTFKRDKALNDKWEYCTTQAENQGIPTEGRQAFIKECFEG